MRQPAAIVTGSSKGLGLSLAERLVQNGYYVVGIHRGRSPDPRWGKLLAEKKAAEVVGSVAAQEVIDKAYNLATSNDLQIVVNSAGAGVFGAAGGYNRKDVDDIFEANLIGTILLSEKVFAGFKQTGGTIVNVMSTAAQVARANEAVYCASKWGARGYTESLRLEAKGSKARVIAVYPGGMRTTFWKGKGGQNTDASKFMDPDNVANVIVDAIKNRPDLYVSDITINRA